MGEIWENILSIPGNMPVKFEVRIALTILELLAFNAQKFKGSCDHGHVPF